MKNGDERKVQIISALIAPFSIVAPAVPSSQSKPIASWPSAPCGGLTIPHFTSLFLYPVLLMLSRLSVAFSLAQISVDSKISANVRLMVLSGKWLETLLESRSRTNSCQADTMIRLDGRSTSVSPTPLLVRRAEMLVCRTPSQWSRKLAQSQSTTATSI